MNPSKSCSKRLNFWLMACLLLSSISQGLASEDIEKAATYIYCLKGVSYYNSPEPERVTIKRGMLGDLRMRADRVGLFRAGTKLQVFGKKLDPNGKVFYQVADPKNKEKLYWVGHADAELTEEDPRQYFVIHHGNRKISGHVVFGVYSDDSGGSLQFLEFEDELFGDLKLDMHDAERIELNEGSISVKMKGDNSATYTGKIPGADTWFVFGETSGIKLSDSDKSFTLVREGVQFLDTKPTIQNKRNQKEEPTHSRQVVERKEIEFFLERKVSAMGKIIANKYVWSVAIENFKGQGLKVDGPKLLDDGENYLVRYHVSGKDRKGNIWDENLDFEVNSGKDICRPVSELAIHLEKSFQRK